MSPLLPWPLFLNRSGALKLILNLFSDVSLYIIYERIITNAFADVKQFIRCTRYETLTLHTILQNFSTSACDWLASASVGAQQQHRVSVSDALKRREMLEDFLFWYFDSFVLPLLKVRP
jgi:hypothetical protein